MIIIIIIIIISKNDKTEERWSMLGQRIKKQTQVKQTIQGNKREATGERRKTKKISRQGKIKQTK